MTKEQIIQGMKRSRNEKSSHNNSWLTLCRQQILKIYKKCVL